MIKNTDLKDSYYREYKPNDPLTNVDRLRYMRIISGFIRFIIKKMFEGYDVRLAGGRSLGTLCIRGRKLDPIILEDGTIRGLPTNWPETWKLWNTDSTAKAEDRRIYHLNEHSNGIKYKICWYCTGMAIANKHLYMLKITTSNNTKKEGVWIGIGRQLTRAIIDDNREYIVNVKREPYVKSTQESSQAVK